MNLNQHGIEHFLKLARRGAMQHASAGEERAHRMLNAVVEHAAGLDSMALDGVADFVRLLSVDYTLAMKLAAPRERVAS